MDVPETEDLTESPHDDEELHSDSQLSPTFPGHQNWLGT